MNKKGIIISVVASVVAVFVILIAIGLYRQKPAPVSDYRPTIVSPQLKQDTVAKPDNRELYRSDFMEGCLKGVSMYDYCDCTYDYLCDKYGIDTLFDAALNLESANSKAILEDGAEHCIHLFK